jgi:hypothetical protein
MLQRYRIVSACIRDNRKYWSEIDFNWYTSKMAKYRIIGLKILSFLLLACLFTIVSFFYQRPSQNLFLTSHECPPEDTSSCLESILVGGFPLPYVFDNQFISAIGGLEPFFIDYVDINSLECFLETTSRTAFLEFTEIALKTSIFASRTAFL